MVKMVMMVVCLVVAFMGAEALTCSDVVSSMAPCFGYLRRGGPVPPTCCSSVKGLNDAAKSTPDRQTACMCLKGVYNSNAGISISYASSLPGKCGVNVPYKITPSIDCSKVH